MTGWVALMRTKLGSSLYFVPEAPDEEVALADVTYLMSQRDLDGLVEARLIRVQDMAVVHVSDAGRRRS